MSDQMTLLFIFYLVYVTLESVPVTRCVHVHKADSYQISYMDKKIWLSWPLSTITTYFFLFSKIAKIAFVLFIGFYLGSKWYYSAILFAASIPIAFLISTVIEKTIGSSLATTIILPTLPIIMGVICFKTFNLL